jgi:hypothetical protein
MDEEREGMGAQVQAFEHRLRVSRHLHGARMVSHVVRHWHSRLLRCSWQHWQWLVASVNDAISVQTSRQLRLMLVLGRLSTSVSSRAWRVWRSFIVAKQSADVCRESALGVLVSFSGRCWLRVVGQCLRVWCVQTMQNVMDEEREGMGAQVQAFEHRLRVSRHLHGARMVSHVVCHWHSRLLRRSWQQWQCLVDSGIASDEALASTSSKLFSLLVRAIFGCIASAWRKWRRLSFLTRSRAQSSIVSLVHISNLYVRH